MESYPKNALEFQDWFCSEEACRDYIIHMRWPNGFFCPRCNSNKAWYTKRHKFHCAQCDHQTSIIVDTIFEEARKPLRVWFQAMWYAVNQKQGVSALGLQQALGLGSYRTAWSWLHKLRRAMVRRGRDRLHGLVEVDETLIGGPKPGKRGRGASGNVLVLVAVEDREGTKQKGIGRIRLKVIPNASGPILLKAIKEMVEPGSTIRTDGWKGYNGLVEKGYKHIVVKHEEEKPGHDPSPLVHRIASLLKRWLLGTHMGRVIPENMEYYLDEYTFRFNRRRSRSRGKLFYCLMQQALEINPVPCATLKTKHKM
jgi:transposase-like protein